MGHFKTTTVTHPWGGVGGQVDGMTAVVDGPGPQIGGGQSPAGWAGLGGGGGHREHQASLTGGGLWRLPGGHLESMICN